MKISMSAGAFFLTFLFTATAVAQEQSDHTNEISGESFSGFSMQRGGSGMSWMPDSSPIHAVHHRFGEWDVMAHGNLFLRYTDQDVGNSGDRGGDQFDVPNWFMVIGSRSLDANDQFMLKGMFSFEPFTVGKKGYPLLFQSGETADGERLIDRQHPHELIGELSAAYSHSLDNDRGFFLYFGLPGEPALGPPVYIHRPSAFHNPDAPLGHHWQDSTHITFGVATLGLRYHQFKLEGSLFNGKEPDENRYDIDHPRFDSSSVRLSMNPLADTAFQVSYGYLKNPEILEPGIDIHRTTASLLWNYPVGADMLSTALIWGMNKPDSHKAQHSYLVEADYRFDDNALFTRGEYVKKSGEEIGVASFEDRLFSVTVLSLGVSKALVTTRYLSLSLGALGTIYGVESDLRPVYGDSPFSVEVFFQISPALMRMEEHDMHGGEHTRM